jgi:hypothetical protein
MALVALGRRRSGASSWRQPAAGTRDAGDRALFEQGEQGIYGARAVVRNITSHRCQGRMDNLAIVRVVPGDEGQVIGYS